MKISWSTKLLQTWTTARTTARTKAPREEDANASFDIEPNTSHAEDPADPEAGQADAAARLDARQAAYPKPDTPTLPPTQTQTPMPDTPKTPPAPTPTPKPDSPKTLPTVTPEKLPTAMPDTPKTPPAVTPDTSKSKPTECHVVLTHRITTSDPKQAPMQELTMSPVQNPKKATTPTQKPSHTLVKRASHKR
ncbi:hypothetical protein PF008_g6029 [Phytophthora fragariae]|uniref:Uncharacterized protein n=1 Tax=Phytophthora fragariae TaxID=53985 RepID=A0A6G0S7M6_9STRA|nr:hypothetical protein PF008_g6029 [Phytophthora fragariae]